jgi:hypothetical protein
MPHGVVLGFKKKAQGQLYLYVNTLIVPSFLFGKDMIFTKLVSFNQKYEVCG